MGYWDGHAEGMSSAFHVARIVEDRMANEMHQNAAEWEQYANEMCRRAADWEQYANELKAKLTEWEQYASDLQSRLNLAERQTVANTAQWAGEEAVCRQYREALAMFAPDHPFLTTDQELMEEVRVAAAVKYAQGIGFDYNAVTREAVRKA